MQNNSSYQDTLAIEKSIRANFLGIFRCSLDSIAFPTELEPIDNLKVSKILTHFDDQFLRYPDKAITAIVSGNETISEGDRSDLSQRESPAPIIQTPVICIHGRHRIIAARRFCSKNPAQERWWYARIYSKSLSKEGQHYLAHYFDFQVGRTEGEIYRQIRLLNDPLNLLLHQLKPNQQSQLGTFWRHADVAEALDSLLAFEGLWKSGFSISKLQRVCSMKCDKEMCQYLVHLQRVWAYILLNKEELFGCLDTTTVFQLQLRVPGLSIIDRDFVEEKMADMTLFPAIETQLIRQEILERLRRVKVLIPSLSSFFRYLIFLEECANIMKQLVPKGAQSTMIYEFITRQTNTSPNTTLQISETQFAERAELVPDAKYKQVWLFCMRNFAEMKVAKEDRKTKSNIDITRTSSTRWRYFASLSERFGIRVTPGVRRHGTDHEMEMELQGWILRHRPKDIYYYDLVSEVQQTMAQMDRFPLVHNTGMVVVAAPTETCQGGVPLKDRFKIRQHCMTASCFLFLDHMKATNQTPGTDISSFFVCKDFYRSFFETDFEISSPLQSPGAPPAPSLSNAEAETAPSPFFNGDQGPRSTTSSQPPLSMHGIASTLSADAGGPESSVQNADKSMQETTPSSHHQLAHEHNPQERSNTQIFDSPANPVLLEIFETVPTSVPIMVKTSLEGNFERKFISESQMMKLSSPFPYVNEEKKIKREKRYERRLVSWKDVIRHHRNGETIWLELV